MSKLRANIFIRFTAVFLVAWGIFLQLSTVYACEKQKSKKLLVCCCDLSKTLKQQCHDDGNNDKSAPELFKSTDFTACCQLTVGAFDSSIATNPNAQLNNVALLLAAQPPPIALIDSFAFVSKPGWVAIPQPSDVSFRFPQKSRYLQTSRLRI